MLDRSFIWTFTAQFVISYVLNILNLLFFPFHFAHVESLNEAICALEIINKRKSSFSFLGQKTFLLYFLQFCGVHYGCEILKLGMTHFHGRKLSHIVITFEIVLFFKQGMHITLLMVHTRCCNLQMTTLVEFTAHWDQIVYAQCSKDPTK